MSTALNHAPFFIDLQYSNESARAKIPNIQEDITFLLCSKQISDSDKFNIITIIIRFIHERITNDEKSEKYKLVESSKYEILTRCLHNLGKLPLKKAHCNNVYLEKILEKLVLLQNIYINNQICVSKYV